MGLLLPSQVSFLLLASLLPWLDRPAHLSQSRAGQRPLCPAQSPATASMTASQGLLLTANGLYSSTVQFSTTACRLPSQDARRISAALA